MDVADEKWNGKGNARQESKSLSLQVPASIESFDFTDDIDCKVWLTEINLAQYTETFLVNLSIDQKHIRRKRLGQLRQQDLSAMNITNYSHQKRLMEHVRLVLKFPFHSPHRKKEIKDLYVEPPAPVDLFDSRSIDADSEGKSHKTGKSAAGPTSKYAPKDNLSSALERKKQARRRRSFDADVWNSISNMRKKSVNSAAIAEQLRLGVFSNTDETKASSSSTERRGSAVLSGSNVSGTKDRARRWSFHGNDGESNSALVQAGMERAKAMMYGNMALEYDIMLTNLHTLQTEFLNEFKKTINCEVASLFFVNHSSRELLLCSAESRWYRVPFGVGICGYCMETGENVNIPDAYSDYRFNKNMDIKTGFRTRSILCQPVRGMRGGGSIIGVIQMLNKIGGDGTFDANDEELLASFAGKVADVLSVRFTDLINIADKFSGHAMFVGAKGGNLGDKVTNYQSHTSSSASAKYNAGARDGDGGAGAGAVSGKHSREGGAGRDVGASSTSGKHSREGGAGRDDRSFSEEK